VEPRTRRTTTACLVALVLAGILVTGPASASADASSPWTRPVAGRVVRPFVAPKSRYGAGHRGADLAATPGTPVRAAGTGRVVFAGPVAGTRHVVVEHDDGLKTTK
jgi:murein DD-endopeptidase MepM/ murein hydrolase activator NlpD